MHSKDTSLAAGAAVALVAGVVAAAALAGAVGAAAGATPVDAAGVTTVSACQTIDEPGEYALTANVTDATGDGCFVVAADGVALHGNGHVVAAGNATGAAVEATDASRVTVTGVQFEGWQTGVAFDGVQRGTVADNEFVDVSVVAVSLEGGTGSVDVADNIVADGTNGVTVDAWREGTAVTGNAFANLTGTAVAVAADRTDVVNNTVVDVRGDGVRVAGARSVTVADNRLNRTVGGIEVADAADVVVRGNAIRDTDSAAVSVAGEKPERPSRHELLVQHWRATQFGAPTFGALDVLAERPPAENTNRVANNTVAAASGDGVLVNGTGDVDVYANDVTAVEDGVKVRFSSNVTVANNTVRANRDDGVHLANATHNAVRGNAALANGDDGVYVVGSDNAVANNTLRANGDDGVDVQNASRASVTANAVLNNSNDGVFLRGVQNSTVANNTVQRNADDGVDLRGSRNVTVVDNAVCGNGDRELIERNGSTGNTYRNNGC